METKLELWLPTTRNKITQRFGRNANTFYADNGLKGHTAIDWAAIRGEPGYNCAENAYVYSTMNKDNPDPMKYRAVFTLVETSQGSYEISYGHCDEIYAEVGKTYKAGAVLYTAGNTGDVYSNGVFVSKKEKLAGSSAGTHFHCPQVRPVKRVKTRKANKQYLSDGHGALKRDGDYFEILDYENGYNGCIDPSPFFNGYHAKDRDKVLSTLEKLIELLRRILGV